MIRMCIVFYFCYFLHWNELFFPTHEAKKDIFTAVYVCVFRKLICNILFVPETLCICKTLGRPTRCLRVMFQNRMLNYSLLCGNKFHLLSNELLLPFNFWRWQFDILLPTDASSYPSSLASHWEFGDRGRAFLFSKYS